MTLGLSYVLAQEGAGLRTAKDTRRRQEDTDQ
jgi:hypothetical protein